MKWKCTYAPEERDQAAAGLAALLRLHPGAKVRRDKSKGPRLAVYVTIDSRETLEKSGKFLDEAAPGGYNKPKEQARDEYRPSG